MSKKNNDYSDLIEIVRKKVKSRGVDMKSLLSKIKDEFNSEFGYIVMSFTIKRTVGLFRGQKVTGVVF